MRNAAVRLALRSLVGFAALTCTAMPAVAAVVANDASYTFPLDTQPGSLVSISLNVTENDNGLALPLVAGSPRPLQLIDATSTTTSVTVMRNRNCLLISFMAPGPTTFDVVN